jgi:hypothetical protein
MVCFTHLILIDEDVTPTIREIESLLPGTEVN